MGSSTFNEKFPCNDSIMEKLSSPNNKLLFRTNQPLNRTPGSRFWGSAKNNHSKSRGKQDLDYWKRLKLKLKIYSIERWKEIQHHLHMKNARRNSTKLTKKKITSYISKRGSRFYCILPIKANRAAAAAAEMKNYFIIKSPKLFNALPPTWKKLVFT